MSTFRNVFGAIALLFVGLAVAPSDALAFMDPLCDGDSIDMLSDPRCFSASQKDQHPTYMPHGPVDPTIPTPTNPHTQPANPTFDVGNVLGVDSPGQPVFTKDPDTHLIFSD